LPLFYDDNYAYSTYGRDAPSTVESLGVNDKVTDWIKDVRMPSIDEDCGSVISDSITNEEMLDHLYGHGTMNDKKKDNARDSIGSTDSGIGSEDGKEPSQKSLYVSEQHAEELLNTTANEGQILPEGDGRAISRPNSLSRPRLSQTGASKHVGHPDTPMTPAVGGGQANVSPKTQDYFAVEMNRLPSVSDSVFTYFLSEGNYVDCRIASTGDGNFQSPTIAGEGSPGVENISFPSCFTHDSVSHNVSSKDDQCTAPNIGAYQSQDIAESAEDDSCDITRSHPNTMSTAAHSKTCVLPFHLKPISETIQVGQYYVRFTDVHAIGHDSDSHHTTLVQVGNYVSHCSMENDDQTIERSTICNESPFPSKFSNNHYSANNSCLAYQHTTLTDGTYMSHSESMSDVTVTMSHDHTCCCPATGPDVPSNASETALHFLPVQCHVPITGQCTSCDSYDNTMNSGANRVPLCSTNDSADLEASHLQHNIPQVGGYLPYNADVKDNSLELQISKYHKAIDDGHASFTETRESKVQFGHQTYVSHDISTSIKHQLTTETPSEYMPYHVAIDLEDNTTHMPQSPNTLSFNLCPSINPSAKLADGFAFPNSSLTVAFQFLATDDMETTAEYNNQLCTNSSISPDKDTTFIVIGEDNMQVCHQSNEYVSELITNYN